MNVAPLDRAPGALKGVGPAISDWNLRISRLAHNLSSTYDDARVFNLDTNKLFTQVLANVSSFPMTSQIKNTTGYCPAYERVYKNIYVRECDYSVNEYMWMNTWHPAYPMHDAIAFRVSNMLSGRASGENSTKK